MTCYAASGYLLRAEAFFDKRRSVGQGLAAKTVRQAKKKLTSDEGCCRINLCRRWT